MQQQDSNFISMLTATLANLKKNENLWAGDPEITETIGILERILNEVTNTTKTQSGLVGAGYTIDKNNVFDVIIDKTFRLCKKMSAYAKKKGDNALLALVDHSISSLSRGIEKDAINRCMAIADAADARLSNLTNFKITADDISAIKSLIVTYNQHVDGRSTTNNEKSALGKSLPDKIEILRHNIDILDDLIDGFIEDPIFIASHKSARVVNDYGTGKTLENKEKETPKN